MLREPISWLGPDATQIGPDGELAILFTDLVGFSSWAVHAGDNDSLALLRRVDADVTAVVEECGSDFIGVDVNIAARLCEAAKPGEILMSDTVVGELDHAPAGLRGLGRRMLRGVPSGVSLHALA